MGFSDELIAMAKSAKTEDELLKLAREKGVAMTEEEAKCCFSGLHQSGELSDDELDNVAGGCGSSDIRPAPVTMGRANDGKASCPYCGGALDYPRTGQDASGYYDLAVCKGCGKKFRHYLNDGEWTEN